MTPRFTEREREVIREHLLDSGHRRFSTAGLQKTSVEELATDAGIAKGSFYAFFGSKEELFIAVNARLARQKSELAAAEAYSAGAAGAEALRAFIVNGAKAMADGTSQGHLLFREEDAEIAMRKLTPEVVMRYVNAGEHWLTPAARVWQEHGLAQNLDPEVLAEVVAMVTFLPLNPGIQRGPRFDEAFSHVVDAVVGQLSAGMVEAAGPTNGST